MPYPSQAGAGGRADGFCLYALPVARLIPQLTQMIAAVATAFPQAGHIFPFCCGEGSAASEAGVVRFRQRGFFIVAMPTIP